MKPTRADQPRLVPGLRLVRRDRDHLQLGVDPPQRVILLDRPDVRRLVGDLANGHLPARLTGEAARALDQILDAGLVMTASAEAARRARLAQSRVVVDAAPEVARPLVALLQESGARVGPGPDDPSVVVVVADGEPARGRLDPLVQAQLPHLIVSLGPSQVVVGPFVVPGRTACLRCLDGHLGETDPRRALVVEQVASQPALVPGPVDPALRTLAVAWAARELLTFVEGAQPATWSATVRLTRDLETRPQPWLRHPLLRLLVGDGLALGVG